MEGFRMFHSYSEQSECPLFRLDSVGDKLQLFMLRFIIHYRVYKAKVFQLPEFSVSLTRFDHLQFEQSVFDLWDVGCRQRK